MKHTYTFDDIALVPKYDNIGSRTDETIDLSTWLTKKTKIDIPIIASNMDTVICEDLAHELIINGSLPIYHRFTNIKQQLKWAKRWSSMTYMSIGINPDFRVLERYAKWDIAGLCVDVAHGHSEKMLNLIRQLKRNFDFEIIAGNVCTADGYVDLASAGADAIKVGIGPGAACTTRITTGFGVPQFSAIQDCASKAKNYSVPIIADGGIRNSADIAKALAAGATTVMIGKLFALTRESAAEKRFVCKSTGRQLTKGCEYQMEDPEISKDYKLEAKYRGQASKDFQDEFKGGLKEGTVAEGEAFWAPVTGSTQDLINKLLGGLRSSMTYGGARTIGEFQRKSEYVIVSNTYQNESNIRK